MRIAIDPGKYSAGVAVFDEDTGKLLNAFFVKDGIGTLIVESVVLLVGYIDKIVIEKPQVYQLRHQKGDQNDLIDVAIMAGSLYALFSRNYEKVEFILPRQWKGQLPKSVSKKRVETLLTDAEKDRIEWPKRASLRHNVIDAIHMGLRLFTKRDK